MITLDSTKRVTTPEISAKQHAIANEWEQFVSSGKLSKDSLRPVIANSWLRSREIGINPLEERARSVISADEVEAKLHREHLGLSGKNVLDRMSQTVCDTGHVIVMADYSGRILYSVGHQQVQNKLEEINFMPGSEWHEDVVGPNGVGTPIAVGHAELVLGSEHYCKGWQPWVCYGAPIQNPSNQTIMGCIDITGPASSVSVEAMALAISIAQTIETNLSLIQLKKREKLRNAFNDIKIKYSNDALLVIDDCGYIIDINSRACSLLDLSSPILLKIPVHMVFPDLWNIVMKQQNTDREYHYELELKNNLVNHVNCRMVPVKFDHSNAGTIIHITSGKIINKFDKKSLRSYEDELIKLTLDKAGGNISKAAKILNIDRSTIYRKMKKWY